jgi:hypothetical protein
MLFVHHDLGEEDGSLTDAPRFLQLMGSPLAGASSRAARRDVFSGRDQGAFGACPVGGGEQRRGRSAWRAGRPGQDLNTGPSRLKNGLRVRPARRRHAPRVLHFVRARLVEMILQVQREAIRVKHFVARDADGAAQEASATITERVRETLDWSET